MRDRFGRSIDYLRISVTDRCNLRCAYCIPLEGVPPLRRDQVLSYEEIAGFARLAVDKGITRIRLTGGEPLVRRDVHLLVRMLADIPGVEDLSMTTNGLLLEQQAHLLKQAGLMRVNVSLDTLDPLTFKELTRGGNLARVLRGIDAANREGLKPIKLNCVVGPDYHEQDARDVGRYGDEHGFEVRYIHLMNLEEGDFSVVEGGTGGDCARCNRLRLTCDGIVKPCLFSDVGFSVREMGAREALAAALAEKPEAGTRSVEGRINRIGG